MDEESSECAKDVIVIVGFGSLGAFRVNAAHNPVHVVLLIPQVLLLAELSGRLHNPIYMGSRRKAYCTERMLKTPLRSYEFLPLYFQHEHNP